MSEDVNTDFDVPEDLFAMCHVAKVADDGDRQGREDQEERAEEGEVPAPARGVCGIIIHGRFLHGEARG